MVQARSGTSLVRRLGIDEGHRLAFLEAPAGFRQLLGELPSGVQVLHRARAPLDRVVFFARKRAELEKRVEKLRGYLADDGTLWVAWPTPGSAAPTDLTREAIAEVCVAGGLVEGKVCSIDDTWSALSFTAGPEGRPRR